MLESRESLVLPILGLACIEEGRTRLLQTALCSRNGPNIPNETFEVTRTLAMMEEISKSYIFDFTCMSAPFLRAHSNPFVCSPSKLKRSHQPTYTITIVQYRPELPVPNSSSSVVRTLVRTYIMLEERHIPQFNPHQLFKHSPRYPYPFGRDGPAEGDALKTILERSKEATHSYRNNPSLRKHVVGAFVLGCASLLLLTG